MAEVTIYASASGGRISCAQSSIADCYSATSGSTPETDAALSVGVDNYTTTYYNAQMFYAFANEIAAGSTINSVVLTLTGTAWGVSGSGTLEAHAFDWSSGGLLAGDYQSSSDLTTLHSSAYVASCAIPGNGAAPSCVFTSEDAFATSIVCGGTTYLVVHHIYSRTAPAWDGVKKITLYTQYETGSPTSRPKIVIDYTEGSTATYSGRGIGRGIARGVMRCLPTLDPWKRDPSGLLLPA